MNNIITQKNMKSTNLNEVLDIVRKNGELTRREILQYSGLSWGGTSQIITQLLQKKLVITKESGGTASGRRPETISLNGNDNYVLGIDINLSGIYAVLVNLKSEIIYQSGIKPEVSERDELINATEGLISDIREKYKHKNIMAIGISMQGRVDEKNGISGELDKINNWKDVPIKDIFEEKFGIPVHIAHDPECLLTAVASDDDALLLRLDFGIGMAVKKCGELISAAGMLELGKTVCENGMRLDDYATITGLSQSFGITPENFDDAKNSAAFDKMASQLGVALSTAVLIFDVKKVYICGELLKYGKCFLNKTESIVKKYCGEDTVIEIFDVKKAAEGAADIAINNKIFVL